MKHNCHPHKLHVATNIPFENQTQMCYACKAPIFGTCYTCSPCNFYLHKFCYDLPQSGHFPSHPQHTLTLVYPPYCKGSCDACGEPSEGFTYTCQYGCTYNIHAGCATVLNPKNPQDDRGVYTAMMFRYVMNALKAVKSQMGSSSGGGTTGTQQMDAELARRRHNMYMQQIQRASDSIDYMGQIGTNNYVVRYL